jgi:hypothetical protein
MVGIVRKIAGRFGNAALGIGFVAYRDFGDDDKQLEVRDHGAWRLLTVFSWMT